MSGSRFHDIVLLSAAVLMLQGCTSYKLIHPEPQIAPADSAQAYRTAGKYSYSLRRLQRGTQRRPEGVVMPLSLVKQALLDSLSAYGIRDVIQSDRIEQDRVKIIAYQSDQALPADRAKHYLSFPWALASLATLSLVPFYQEVRHPVEIHVIKPMREHDEQLRIIHADYVTGEWWWLPFLFMPNDETRKDVYYGAYGWPNARKLDSLGWRRIFDGVVVDLIRDTP